MEVECDTEEKLDKLVKKLDLMEEKLFHPGTMYESLYGAKNKKAKKGAELTFNTAKKVFIKRIKKNKSLFLSILKAQQKYVKSLSNE